MTINAGWYKFPDVCFAHNLAKATPAKGWTP